VALRTLSMKLLNLTACHIWCYWICECVPNSRSLVGMGMCKFICDAHLNKLPPMSPMTLRQTASIGRIKYQFFQEYIAIGGGHPRFQVNCILWYSSRMRIAWSLNSNIQFIIFLQDNELVIFSLFIDGKKIFFLEIKILCLWYSIVKSRNRFIMTIL